MIVMIINIIGFIIGYVMAEVYYSSSVPLGAKIGMTLITTVLSVFLIIISAANKREG